MQPRLTDSGTFISPVDKVNEKRGLSQVVDFLSKGCEKKPALILVPTNSSFELTFGDSASSRWGTPGTLDANSLRATLRSPPPEVARFRRHRRIRMLIYFGTFCGFVGFLVFVVIIASIWLFSVTSAEFIFSDQVSLGLTNFVFYLTWSVFFTGMYPYLPVTHQDEFRRSSQKKIILSCSLSNKQKIAFVFFS